MSYVSNHGVIDLSGTFVYDTQSTSLTTEGETATSNVQGTLTIQPITTTVPRVYKITLTEGPHTSYVIGSAPNGKLFSGIGNQEYEGMFSFQVLSTTCVCVLSSFRFTAYSTVGQTTYFREGIAKRKTEEAI